MNGKTPSQLIIKQIGKTDYYPTWQAMKNFTETRSDNTPDELWIVEHPPVFTLGLAGKPEHILSTNHEIPLIHCDRGGQITYHGPGQLVIYTMIDLKRANLSIRQLVENLENSIINYLQSLNIPANSNRDAPGVYIEGKKIASLGLKVRKNCTYHGLSFNVKMDLTPFSYINVCGYAGLQVTQLSDFIQVDDLITIANQVTPFITQTIYGT